MQSAQQLHEINEWMRNLKLQVQIAEAIPLYMQLADEVSLLCTSLEMMGKHVFVALLPEQHPLSKVPPKKPLTVLVKHILNYRNI